MFVSFSDSNTPLLSWRDDGFSCYSGDWRDVGAQEANDTTRAYVSVGTGRGLDQVCGAAACCQIIDNRLIVGNYG